MIEKATINGIEIELVRECPECKSEEIKKHTEKYDKEYVWFECLSCGHDYRPEVKK